MQLKQADFFEALENKEIKLFYSDIFGLCPYRSLQIEEVNTAEEGWRNASEVYIKDPSKSSGYRNVRDLRIFEIEKIFSLELFQIQEDKRRYRSYYGYNNASISADNEESVEISAIRLTVNGKSAVEFPQKALGKLNRKVYIIEDDRFELKKLNVALLTEDEFLCYSRGNHGATYKVEKVYEPNPEKKLFRAVSLFDHTEIDITENEKENCYEVPYCDYPDEYAQFNEMLHENMLKPMLMRGGHAQYDKTTTFHLQWLPVEAASRYIVSVYKVNKILGWSKLYFLQDYYIDRNTCQFILENMLGDGYIFRISAENRAGEIIAKSRGIAGGEELPRFWEKK